MCRNGILAIALFCVLLCPLLGQGQDKSLAELKMPEVMPPSPTAGELGRYGLSPVSLATGAPTVSIPLHTFATKNLTVPVSLSYGSNGVKVDQVSTWVGMGFSLNAGGVVTRVIRDDPDGEQPLRPYPTKDPQSMDPYAVQYVYDAADPAGVFDTEPDLFTFNFQGYSGKFVFGDDGSVIVMPHQNLKVVRIVDSDGVDGGVGRVIITTPNGVIYSFGGDNATELSRTENEGRDCGKTYDTFKETSWYLTTIEHPQGDVIHFEYGRSGYKYATGVSQTVTRLLEQRHCEGGGICPPTTDNTCVSSQSIRGSYLKRIWSDNFGELVFDATRDRMDIDDYKLDAITVKDARANVVKKFVFGYQFSTSGTSSTVAEVLKYRMFLTSVIEQDGGLTNKKTYQLDYEDINALPPRLSYSQDHWGYFNGRTNRDFVPADNTLEDNNGLKVFDGVGGNRELNTAVSGKGMLKKITYPTGGNIQFVYEQNTYWDNDRTVLPEAKSARAAVEGDDDSNKLVTDVFTFYNLLTQEVRVFAGAQFDETKANEPYDPRHNVGTMAITDNTNGRTIWQRTVAAGEVVDFYLDLDKNTRYSFSVSTRGKGSFAQMHFDYYPEPARTVPANVPTGGVRIASTLAFDPVTTKTEITNYGYSNINSPERSSGKTKFVPNYFLRSTSQFACGALCEFIGCNYGMLVSSSQNTLYPSGGNNIYYEYVTVSRGDDFSFGAEEHHFLIHNDAPGRIVSGQPILNAPYSNIAWDNGLEIGVKNYARGVSNSFVLTRDVSNQYIADDRNNRSATALIARRRYQPVCPLDQATLLCDESNTHDSGITLYSCDANHPHIYSYGPFMNGDNGRCIAPGAHNVVSWSFKHPCTTQNKLPGDQVAVWYALDHIDAIEYSNIAFWFYLKSTTETRYDEAGLNPVTTVQEYYYDNPEHVQLTKTRMLQSDGRTTEKKMWYADDYGDVENIATLKEKSLTGLVIKSESSVGTVQTAGVVTRYNDLGQPTEHYQYERAIAGAAVVHDTTKIIPSANYRRKASFNYDPVTHNVIAVKEWRNPDVVYLWGYNGSRVVASATGASVGQLYYTSFEETGTEGSAKTGSHYYNGGTYTIATTDFNPASTAGLRMSYWYWDGSQWKFSGDVPFSRTITRGTRLDEIRVYPANAQMTTLTYDLCCGVKTTTDPNNLTTIYEYDDLSRLIRVRDHAGNIIKEVKYHYYNNND